MSLRLGALGAWFFPESDEVIGEIAATGCRNQPGEKIENKIAGKPMPSRRKGKLLCQRHANNRRKKKDPTLNAQLLSARPEIATASKATATGEGPSHYYQPRCCRDRCWSSNSLCSSARRPG